MVGQLRSPVNHLSQDLCCATSCGDRVVMNSTAFFIGSGSWSRFWPGCPAAIAASMNSRGLLRMPMVLYPTLATSPSKGVVRSLALCGTGAAAGIWAVCENSGT